MELRETPYTSPMVELVVSVIRRCLIAMLGFLFFGGDTGQAHATKPAGASAGVFRVGEGQLSAHPYGVKLAGEWRFAWGKALEPAPWVELVRNMPEVAPIPGAWADIPSNTEPGGYRSESGYASYALRLDDVPVDQPLVFLARGICTAATLYVLNEDGRILTRATRGKSSVDADDEIPIFYRTLSAELSNQHNLSQSETNSLVLLLQVSNHHMPRGGMGEPPMLMTREQLHIDLAYQSLLRNLIF